MILTAVQLEQGTAGPEPVAVYQAGSVPLTVATFRGAPITPQVVASQINQRNKAGHDGYPQSIANAAA